MLSVHHDCQRGGQEIDDLLIGAGKPALTLPGADHQVSDLLAVVISGQFCEVVVISPLSIMLPSAVWTAT